MAETIETIKYWLKDCVKLKYPKWWTSIMLVIISIIILGIITNNQ